MPPHRRSVRSLVGVLGLSLSAAVACVPTKAGIAVDGAPDVDQGNAPGTGGTSPDTGAIDAALDQVLSGSGGAVFTPGTGGAGGSITGAAGATAVDAGQDLANLDQAPPDQALDVGGDDSGGGPMDMTCDFQSPCVCAAGQTCRIACPAGGCMVQCGEGATCTIDCSGGGCMTMCGVGAACAPTCGTTGGCNTVCANDARCDVACLGGGCMSDCTAPGAMCTVSCVGEGCLTMCQDATSSCNVSCNAGCPLKCGDATNCFVNCRADPDSCQLL